MVDFYAEKQRLKELEDSLSVSRDAMRIDGRIRENEELRALQSEDGFWNDVERAQSVSRTVSHNEKLIFSVGRLVSELADITELIALVEEAQDEAEAAEVRAQLIAFAEAAERLSVEALLTGKYDGNNAILTLHAGAGGTEAQDWVQMLYRMYRMYADAEGYGVDVLDELPGDEAGIKSVSFLVKGDNAYGFLKAEKGVHRLVRISPFDSNKRRHTSFASLEVMPEITDTAEIRINPEDLKIDTYRSGGAGGQHVNKTESAIRITHIPTGIVVACQNERSQVQNRETAMKMLIGRLIEKREREQTEEAASIKGELKKIEWGSQIRSYVFCPYTLVKDHRTGEESTNVDAVMNGDIKAFITGYLKKC